MPDASTQLRAYFDETVERVTEEDVRIRATTERGIPVPSPRFRPRPFAAGAIGFGLAMTLLGMVLVADRLFGAGLSDVGGNGGGEVFPSTRNGSPWLFIPVVFGLGLLATGFISARRQNGDMRERGEGTMQTIEKVGEVEAPRDDEVLTLKKRNRWLGWLAGILAVAVVTMGAWMIFGDDDGRSLTAQQEQTLDGFLAAWNAGDGEAAAEFMMPSAYHDNGANRYFVAEGKFADFVEMTKALGFSIEPGDQRAAYGDFVVSWVKLAGDTDETFSVFRMTPDGTRIQWHLAP